MNVDALVFFADVVDAGSFATAARKLGIDRSGVSRRMRDLEREVGAQLIRRTTRTMRLTDIGSALYERCLAIRKQADEAAIVVRSMNSVVRGPLHISCGSLLVRTRVNQILWAFSREYPEVSLSVTLRNDVVDYVGDGIDVALRVTDDLASNVVARDLGPVQWDMCASPAYLAEHGTPRTPADLVDHAWLDVRQKSALEFSSGEQSIRVSPRTRFACIDYSILQDAALAGLGIGFIPSYASAALIRAGQVKPVLKGYKIVPSLGTRLYAITPHSRFVPTQVRSFIDFVRAALRKGGS